MVREIEIAGKVLLSDKPDNDDHGGINILTDNVSTITYSDGSFVLAGVIFIDDLKTDIVIQKDGYVGKVVGVKIPFDQTNTDKALELDIGTIEINRL